MTKRGYACIGLHNPKHMENVGGAMRAAYCYGASLVCIQGRRFHRVGTDTPHSYQHIPVVHGDLHSLIPYNCVPVAVELVEGARSLVNYVHPEQAFYIFGAEDATLGKQVLEWCRDIIYIPTSTCMNLAATVNVVLYDRMSKRGKRNENFAISNRRYHSRSNSKVAG